MHKCPNCGQEFEGKFCPECGAQWQEEKICPQCGATLAGATRFCNECGYAFYESTKQSKSTFNFKEKLNIVWAWIKSHLKIVIPVASAVLLIIILSCAIPAGIANANNGTYYKLGYNGELDKSTYFILKSGKWEDEDGETGTYKKDGENIIFYYTLFGETGELCSGTLKDKVLKVNNDTFISEKHKHKYGEWETTRDTGCTVDGVQARSCSCGVKETQKIPAKGHSYGEWEVTEEPTCTEEGNNLRTCTVCGEEENQDIDMIPHKLGEWEVTKEATCTEEGIQKLICTVCYEETETQVIKTLEHSFGDWQFDSTSHFKVCVGCGQEFNTEAHEGKDSCEFCKYHYGDTVGLSYKLNANKNGYMVFDIGTAKDTEIVIPTSYKGLPITSIGERAFYNCSSLTSVTIPDSVTSIGREAFLNCSGLTSITIPDSVTSIGRGAFLNCSLLKAVYIIDIAAWCNIYYEYTSNPLAKYYSHPLYNGGSLYLNNNLVTNLVIPDSVTSIGLAFYGCSSLTSITIPDSVTSIDMNAFRDCSNLTSITIPDSVTSIGIYAFYGCSSLTSITISDSVTSIGYEAFCACSSLTSITIPDSVTSIDGYAFRDCSNLTSITIPDSVTSIGGYAFYGCSSLTNITYKGTYAQWYNISKGENWNYQTGNYTIHYTDENT